MKRSTLLAAIVLLGGTVLQALLWSRQWIYGDQYALFLSGLDLLETGRLPPVAKYMSGGGHIPGSLLPLLIAGPLEAWTDYRAPALLIGVGHLAAVGVLAATVGRALGISFLAAYLAAYWLSPWRLYHAGFVWEPAYVFLPAALHLACAWRLRAEPHFGWSLLLGATLTATLQLHASFVVLVVLTALLALQGAIRIDWRGAFAGVASGALTLIPTAQAWLASTLPRMTPGETEEFSRVAVGGLNALKALVYCLRLGTPDIGRRLRESSFADAAIIESGVRTGLAAGLLTMLVALSTVSVIVALLASRDYFRGGPALRAGRAWQAGWAQRAGSAFPTGWAQRAGSAFRAASAFRGRSAFRGGDAPVAWSADDWFRAYAGWCFVAMCASAALSPVPVQGWHVVIALHAACLPVAAWLRAAFEGGSAPRRAVAGSFVLLQVAVVLALAFGHPMYQPLSGERLLEQDLPAAVRAIIPASGP